MLNFYIDFEATQPGNRIISIGAVCENGAEFSAYVRPKDSKVTPFITELTGITQSILDINGTRMEDAFIALWNWMNQQNNFISTWNVYSYGDTDVDFIKESMKECTATDALLAMGFLASTLKDASKIVNKFFRGNISLIHAYNYVKALQVQQRHDALEDANMLKVVFSTVNGRQPLAEHPYKTEMGEEYEVCEVGIAKKGYQMPHGQFYCSMTQKFKNEKGFNNIDEAITWVITNFAPVNAQNTVHRDRVAVKIMKALRSKTTYNGYYWRRVKETTEEVIEDD